MPKDDAKIARLAREELKAYKEYLESHSKEKRMSHARYREARIALRKAIAAEGEA